MSTLFFILALTLAGACLFYVSNKRWPKSKKEWFKSFVAGLLGIIVGVIVGMRPDSFILEFLTSLAGEALIIFVLAALARHDARKKAAE